MPNSISRPLTGSLTGPIAESIGLGIAQQGGGGNPILNLIAEGDQGVAIDFQRGVMRIHDAGTPSHNYDGGLAGKLSITGATALGGRFDASNFARLAVASWPYSASAITIAGQIKFDTASDALQRAIFSVDTGGNDRLQVVVLPAADKPTLTVGTGASAVNVTATTSIVADTWFDFVGVSGPLGTYIVINDVVSVTNAAVLAANPAPSAFNGIGADAANTGGAATSVPMKGSMRNLVVLPRAVSKEVAKAGLPFGLSLAAIGDSLTDGLVAGVVDDHALAYPALLEARVPRIVNAINAGGQGDTTSKMWGRRADIAADGVPDIVIIYGGTNDLGRQTTVEASPTPTDTVFTIPSAITQYYSVGAKISVAGEPATIASLVGSVVTLTAPLAAGAPAAGAAILIDTQGNLTLLGNYAASLGCSKVLMVGMHYFNWTSAGDTTSTQRASNVALRTSQAAAAAACGAVYVDLYAYMRQLILDGLYVQGDWTSWHSAIDNQHLNANGQSILADCFYAAMRTHGWL